MSEPQAVKISCVDSLLKQAYEHPKFAQLRFPGSVVCPQCQCELAHVLQETGVRRVLWCAYCGTTYKEKDMVA